MESLAGGVHDSHTTKTHARSTFVCLCVWFFFLYREICTLRHLKVFQRCWIHQGSCFSNFKMKLIGLYLFNKWSGPRIMLGLFLMSLKWQWKYASMGPWMKGWIFYVGHMQKMFKGDVLQWDTDFFCYTKWNETKVYFVEKARLLSCILVIHRICKIYTCMISLNTSWWIQNLCRICKNKLLKPC